MMDIIIKRSSYTNKTAFLPHYYWDPWYGCQKKSEGCLNCFSNRESTPLKVNDLEGKDLSLLQPHTFVVASMATDFFLPAAATYRQSAWKTIKKYPDLIFILITKQAEYIKEFLPEDWGEGYNNVMIEVTAETQKRADERIPILLDIPCKHRGVICGPCLEEIDLTSYLETGKIDFVEACGEKFACQNNRPTRYEWFKRLSNDCKKYNTRFSIVTIGQKFIYNNQTISDNNPTYHSEFCETLELSNPIALTFHLKSGEYIHY